MHFIVQHINLKTFTASEEFFWTIVLTLACCAEMMDMVIDSCQTYYASMWN